MSVAMDALISVAGFDPSQNYSFFAVPAALATCLVPHYLSVLDAGFNVYNNASPRGFRDNVSRDTSIDKIRAQRILRMHAASSNGLETLGFFAGAVLAGNYSGLDTRVLNSLSIGYVLARIAFVLAYVGIRNRRLSWARSFLWNVASWQSIALWIMAGVKLKSKSS